MRLTIQKRQEEVNGQTQFFVACRSLALSPHETEWLRRYGAPPLDTLFGDLAALRAGQGTERTFTDVEHANDFIEQVHGACVKTEHYWAHADAFHGSEDYPPVP